jgi:hypothetical protein
MKDRYFHDKFVGFIDKSVSNAILEKMVAEIL